MRSEGERKVERRSSVRRPIPQVLVELRQSIGSETPDWVGSAVDISLKGILLELPPELGLRELLRLTFTLGDSHVFWQQRAIVLRRDTGDLGMLFFAAWSLDKQEELGTWLREQAFRERHPRNDELLS